MNKLFQLTILTAALSASFSHAMMKRVVDPSKLKSSLLRIWPSNAHRASVSRDLPPSLFLQKHKDQDFIAKVTTTQYFSIRDQKEGKKIIQETIENNCDESEVEVYFPDEE